MTTPKSKPKKDTLETIVEKLRKSPSDEATFYLRLKNGILTVGWVHEDPGEDRTHIQRHLPVGESVSMANIKQSIES